jgi:hypothetical protein
MADLIASLRERACADGSSAKPQGEKRTKTAITTVRETSDLDIVFLILPDVDKATERPNKPCTRLLK